MAEDLFSRQRSTLRFFSRLQVRLLLLLLFILLPALALSIYTFSEQGRLAAENAQQEALRLAQLAAANQNQLVESAEQLLVTLSQIPEVRAGDSDTCNTLFARLKAQYTTFTNIYMVDANADTVCSGLPFPEGFNVRDQLWFQRAMQARGFSVGDYALGALTGRPVVTFSYPIFDEQGDIKYQIGASLDLQAVENFVAGIELPAGATLTAIDRNGTILYRYPSGEEWIGQSWPEPRLVDTVVSQGTGTAEGGGLSGGQRLFGFAPLDATNGSAYLLVGIPQEIAFGESNRLLAQNLIGLGLVGAATLIAAWYGTRFFVGRKVDALVDGAERLKAGDLHARIDLRSVEDTYELSELAHVFNDMAEALEQRQRELEQARDTLEKQVEDRTAELAFLVEASNILASTLEYETTLASVARLAVPRFGDWCSVNIVEEDGSVGQLAVAHVDPTKIESVRHLQERYPADPNAPRGTYNVIRTGVPEFYPDIPDELLVAAARDEEHLQLIRQIGLVSGMTVPLTARGRTLGTISLATAESGRHYVQEDLRLVEELARRAALAVDNARLYREAQQQRQHLQTTLASIGDAVIATNAQGCITFMNPVAQALTGWTEAEAEGKLLREVFHIINEVTSAEVESPVTKVIRDGVIVGLANHTVLIAKDGSRVPIDDSGAPIKDEEGNIVGVVLVFRDVSERRLAEAEIQEQNEIIEAVNRVGQVISAELDLHKLVQNVTDAATELSGAEFGAFFYNVLDEQSESYMLYTISGVPHEKFSSFPMPRNTDLFGPTFRGEGVIRLDDVKKDPRYGKNAPYQGMLEGHLPVTSYLAVPVVSRTGEVLGGLFFGHPEQAVFTTREERLVAGLAAQAAVAIDNAQLYRDTREQRERFRITLASIGDAVIATDLSGQITFMNPIAQALTGWSEADALDRPLDEVFHIVNETTREAVESPVEKVIQHGTVVGLANHTLLIAQDGREMPIDDSGAPIRNEGGNIIGIILVFRDIAERRRTEAAERDQRILAEALRDTAVALNATLELTEVLDRILTHIGRVVPHDLADVMFLEDTSARIVRSRGFVAHGLVEAEDAMQELRQPIAERSNLQWIIEHRQPLAIPDVREYDGWVNMPEARLSRSYLGVPILIDGEVIGLINLNSFTPDFFTPQHGNRLVAFADQAAVAIKNARLYQQAQEAAALEERQRLARDLHDAVSQTLFSANVMAEALPRLWKRQPEKGLEKLTQLSQLIRGAAAEMRSLLLELRPTMVVNTPLAELLTQLTDAIKGRKKIDIALNLQVREEPALPPDVHIALYRIAQESLNNIVKHGQATQATVELYSDLERVEIKIKDNGRGFDPNERSSGFGLTMMQERAQAIGAVLHITTAIGQGTEIQVVWTAPEATGVHS